MLDRRMNGYAVGQGDVSQLHTLTGRHRHLAERSGREKWVAGRRAVTGRPGDAARRDPGLAALVPGCVLVPRATGGVGQEALLC